MAICCHETAGKAARKNGEMLGIAAVLPDKSRTFIAII